MRIFYSATLYSTAKDYVLDKHREMLKICVAPYVDDIVTYGDRELGIGDFVQMPPPSGRGWSDDMLIDAQEQARKDAIAGNYDLLMRCGVDYLFESRDGLRQLLRSREWVDEVTYGDLSFGRKAGDVIMCPLISARTDANVAVCRRFVKKDPMAGGYYGEYQYDIPHKELMSGDIIETGFPGFDSPIIPSEYFDITWTNDPDFAPWYERVAQGRPNLCAAEWFCLQALNRGAYIGCDTAVRTWHVSEDNIARLYPGIETPLSEITWGR